MTAKRDYLKILCLIPLVLLFRMEDFVSELNGLLPSEILAGKIYASMTHESITTFVLTVGNLYFLFVFNLLYGNYIYEDFRVCSVYVFSRTKSRRGWYYRKFFALFRIALLYHLLLLLLYVFLTVLESDRSLDIRIPLVFFYLLCTFGLIALITTALISLIALKTGITIGFLAMYFAEVLFLFCLLLPDKPAWLITLNYANPLGGIAGILAFDLAAWQHLLYLGVLAALLLFFGARYIAKTDIALEDMEVA